MNTASFKYIPQKGFSMLIIIVVVALISGGVFLVSKTALKPQQTVIAPDKSNILKFKDTNEFFPRTINSNEIQPLDGSEEVKKYKVAPWNIKELGKDGSKLEKAVVLKAYKAFYGSDLKRAIVFQYVEFETDHQLDNAQKLNDDTAQNIDQGAQKLVLPIIGVKYWAIYGSAPKGKEDHYAADIRLVFPEAKVMVWMNMSGGFSQDEIIANVKSYVEAVQDTKTAYISPNEILTMEDYQRLNKEAGSKDFQDKANKNADEMKQKFDEETKKAQQQYQIPTK